MTRKTVLMAGVLLIALCAAVAQAEMVITTAYGTGADAGVQNDADKGPTVNTGTATTMAIRHYDDTRAKAAYIKFDISGVGGNTSGATLTVTYTQGTNKRARTMNVYGLVDSDDDLWSEAALCYNNAPGMNPTPLGNLNIDPAKLVLLGTMEFSATDPSTTTSTVDALPLDTFIASDTNGLLTFVLYIEISNSDPTYYVTTKEGSLTLAPTLTLPNASTGVVSNPQPPRYSLQTLELSELCWTTAPDIGKCDVWFGPGEPNFSDYKTVLTKIGTIVNPTTSQCFTIPAGMRPLTNLTTYSWVVDSYKGDPLPSEPNYPGSIWKFTATNLPILIAQPAEQIKSVGETAEFAVSVNSSTTVHYVWYRSPDNANNTPTDDSAVGDDANSLTLPSLTWANEGYYYCIATNTGGSTYSNTANLGVKRKVAHWTLDSLVSGQYADSGDEGHHADPNGTPVFVTGAYADPNGTNKGVTVDSNNGFASAGTWNPSGHTRQMTISLWAKWAGQTSPTSWQGLIAKENAFGAPTMMWQLEADQANNNLALKSGNSTVTSTPLPVGTWIYIVVTYDGTTARIYRNGVNTVSGTFVLGEKTDAPVLIGASAKAADTGTFYSLFNGVLDDVRIYNYAMLQNEIVDIYHAVSGQSVCTGRPTYDYTGDCLVTMADFTRLATNWLSCGLYPLCP